MEQETRQKIQETVKDILSKADMEEMTEFKVRVTASERLGIDLSDFSHKKFIRDLIESFLLSTHEQPNSKPENRLICKLADTTDVVVHELGGKTHVSVRDFYVKNGKELPSATTGVTMTSEAWSALKNSFTAIDEAVTDMQSKLRTKLDGQQNGDVSNSVTASSHEFSPIEATRFDGTNYHCWAEQMELFLKQLQIAYVLTDPCPSLNLSPDATSEELAQTKVAEKKLMNDDYLCRHCILSSLSDSLYYKFSKKAKTAKDLWEELKLVYLYEEFGTKRAQVRKYIEFQIVDGKPIVEQTNELNNIADSIIATGIMIDENFHVSTIISKLPPSWKEFCVKMMREEHLPFRMLMQHVTDEESSRTGVKQAEHSKSPNFHPDYNLGPRTRDIKKPGVSWKKQESEVYGKQLTCNYCGKKGHIARTCRNRIKDQSGRQNGEYSTMPVVTEVNSID